MSTHLSSDALRRLLEFRCHASRAYGWLLHVLHCEDCRRGLLTQAPDAGPRLLRRLTGTRDPVQVPELDHPQGRDRLLQTLQDSVGTAYRRESTVPPVVECLDGAPPARRALLVDNVDRLQTLEVVRHLLETARARWTDQPHVALEDCLLADRVRGHLSPQEFHPRLLADLEGLVWAMTGNVLRILGRLSPAEDCFRRSWTALEQGTGDPAEAAQLHGFQSALERNRQRYVSAARHARAAQELWTRQGKAHLAAGAKIQRYMTLAESGRPALVARQMEHWLDRVDPESIGGRNWLCALSCHSNSLRRAGYALPALRSVPLLRQSLQEYGGYLDLLDLQLHEAQLFQDCGDAAAAEDLLLETRNRYRALDMDLDVAFASFYLMRLYRTQRRRRAARKLASALLPSLERIGKPSFVDEARRLVASA